MPHRALRSFALVLLPALAMSLRAQTPPTATPANDPFAVLAAKEAQEPVAGGVRVVVQKPDGSPAPDAVVVFTPWRDDEAAHAEREAALQQFPADEPLRFALLAASGTRHRVDERGASRVPKSGYVFAFAGDRMARAYVSESFAEPRLELRLAAPHTFTVEVTTADGAPALGVPVAVRDTLHHVGGTHPQTGADGTTSLRLVTTRPAGAMVVLDVATKNKLQAPLPASGERLRLQLPPTTSLDATFTGDAVPGAALRFELLCGDEDRSVPGQPTGDRSARWPFVEVDAALVASVRSGGLELARTTTTARPGADPIALVRQQNEATFALQVLGPDGQPERNRFVQLSWQLRGSRSGTHEVTNTLGWIEIAMPPRFVGKGDVELMIQPMEAAGGPLRSIGKVTTNATGKGRIEMPPLRCEQPPLLASGVFVTSDGKPVPKLEFTVSSPSYLRVVTDAGGRFAIPGADASRGLRCHLSPSWCCVDGEPWKFDLANGTKDARIVVQPAGRVRFASDLQTSVTSIIGYRLERPNGEGSPVALSLALDQRELFVPPGHWDFVVHGPNGELLRLPDLRAESGIETHDPRFMAFDWRAYAIHVAITVRDAAGRPTDACTVWLRHPRHATGTSPTGGVAHLLLPKAGGLVEVAPRDPKIAKIELGMVTKDEVVVLGGGPPLTVTITPMPQLPAGFELVVAIGDNPELPFDAMGTAVVVLPKAGSHAPTIALKRNGNLSPLDWKLAAVDVPANGAKVAIEVTPARQQVLELWLPKPTPK